MVYRHHYWCFLFMWSYSNDNASTECFCNEYERLVCTSTMQNHSYQYFKRDKRPMLHSDFTNELISLHVANWKGDVLLLSLIIDTNGVFLPRSVQVSQASCTSSRTPKAQRRAVFHGYRMYLWRRFGTKLGNQDLCRASKTQRGHCTRETCASAIISEPCVNA